MTNYKTVLFLFCSALSVCLSASAITYAVKNEPGSFLKAAYANSGVSDVDVSILKCDVHKFNGRQPYVKVLTFEKVSNELKITSPVRKKFGSVANWEIDQSKGVKRLKGAPKKGTWSFMLEQSADGRFIGYQTNRDGVPARHCELDIVHKDAIIAFGASEEPIKIVQKKTKPKLVKRAPPEITFPDGDYVTRGALAEYVVHGIIKTAEQLAEVTVNGDLVSLDDNGHFRTKRFFPVGESKVTVKAVDIYGNNATKTMTVVREIPTMTNASLKDPVLTPPKIQVKTNEKTIALIVGIDSYSRSPRAKYADKDALLFYDYARRSLGVPAENIKLLTNEKADLVNVLESVKTWLSPMVTPKETNVVIYFAGHGLATPDGENTYLMVHDSSPAIMEHTALNRDWLLKEIAKVQPKSTLVFLDTCYSGSGRGGDNTLVADGRALVIRPRDIKAPQGFSLFSAASGSQLANSHPSQQHGLFSYYLMRGLGGEADADKNKQLTAKELQDYVLSNVKRSAMSYGRQQTPQLMGDADRVIADWR